MANDGPSQDHQGIGVLDWLEKRFQGLGTAIAETWFYVVLGLAAGIGLARVADLYLKEKTFWHTLVEHLGMGLVVSSIAIILYEWRSHLREVLELAKNLVATSRAEAQENLSLLLKTLLGDPLKLPEGAKELQENYHSIILTLSGLLKSKSRLDLQYVGFIASLQRVVTMNAKAFQYLSEGRPAEFLVPENAAVLAEDALVAQVKALGKGDEYVVISDLRTWQNGQLGEFQAETELSIQRGLRVRRIFNLSHPSNQQLPAFELKKILSFHVASMERVRALEPENPRYQVRWMDSSVLAGRLSEVQQLHYGIFSLSEGGGLIFEFSVPDLSRISISPNPDRIRADRARFEGLWALGRKLDEQSILEIAAKKKERSRNR